MKKYGKIIFNEFTFNHHIEIRKGKKLVCAYIYDKNKNYVSRSRFFTDSDECLNYAFNMVDDFIKYGDYHYSYWNSIKEKALTSL